MILESINMKVLILLPIMFFLIGCASDPIDQDNTDNCSHFPANEFIPQSLGTYQTYNYNLYTNGIVSYQEIRKSIILDTMSYIMNDDQYHLDGMCLLSSQNNFSVSNYSKYYLTKPDGFYYVGFIFDSNRVFIEPELLYKYPVNAGDSWNFKILSTGSTKDSIKFLSTVKYSCVSQDEIFVTPYDTFNTVVYGYSYKQASDVLEYSHTFTYIVSGIGIVGEEYYSSPDTTLSFQDRIKLELNGRLELIDYCIMPN